MSIVLAFSGGLDTSFCVPYLRETTGGEVHTVVVNTGGFTAEELAAVEARATALGAASHTTIDARADLFERVLRFLVAGNVLRGGVYPLCVGPERVVQAEALVDAAATIGATRLAHGSTGAGNDQVRFELSYYALKPDIKVIAPWREWDLTSRTRLLEFAETNQIPIAKDKRGDAPFSVDANLLHSSSEGKILEDPALEADEAVYQRTIRPEDAPDRATVISVDFEHGDPVAINGEKLSPAMLLTRLNELGRANGIGRLDLVENRFVGMKSRGIYETPGGTILLTAHRSIESITLDREACHLKDSIMPCYAELIYNGFWFSPERRMLQALIDESQKSVSGQVRLKLYKGNVSCIGRESPNSLYSMKVVTFEDDQGAYDQFDAQGFIKLNALRLRLGASAGRRGGNL